jgi:hypothetical protein
MFTDEKSLPKNDVVWADDRSDADERGGLYTIEKYPVSIMLGLGVTWYELTRPYFFFKKANASMVKLIMTNCYHFIKRKVMNYWDTKIGGSNKMELAHILIKRFNNCVKRTSNPLFRRKDGHSTRLN